MARRVGVRRRQPDVQREHAGLQPEGEKREPEQRGQLGTVMERPEFPASGDGRENRKKRKQAKRRGVRRGQIEPSGRADLPPLPVECDEKIRAQREKFPSDKELQSVCRNQNHPHEEQHRAPPESAAESRAGMLGIRPVFAGIDRPGGTQDSEQCQKKCADPVEPEMQRCPADRNPDPPVPVGPADEHGNRRRRSERSANDYRCRP